MKSIAAIIEKDQSGEQNRASNIQQPGTRIFDAARKIVTPGLIDIQVHLRETGFEPKVTAINPLVEKMSSNPVGILRLEYGLRIGRPAILPSSIPIWLIRWTLPTSSPLSRSTPYLRLAVEAKPVLNIVGGRIV